MKLAKILANTRFITVGKKTIKLKQDIGWDTLAQADEVYTRFLFNNRFKLPARATVEHDLVKRGTLQDDWQEFMVKCQNQIVLYQEDLYEQRHNPMPRERAEKSIQSIRKQIMGIMSILSEYTKFSIEFLAEKHRELFLISAGIPKPLAFRFKERIYEEMLLQHISDSELRKIARSPEWRNMWTTRRGNAFKYYPLTGEQSRLLDFSLLYDGVMKSRERPEVFVICNDDMLDGWMSLQNKGAATNNKEVSGQANSAEKHGTVFTMVKSKNQAQEVINSNPSNLINKQISKMQAMKKGAVSAGRQTSR